MSWIAALLLGVLAGPDDPPVEEARIDLEADAWYAQPSGWIFITRGSRPGTATRAHEGHEFGLDAEVLPVGEAWVRFWESNALGFRIVPAEESGTHTAAAPFIYHGQTYGAGREIHADVGFLLVDVDYQYRWEVADGVTVVPHAGAEYWGFSSHLRTVDGLVPIDEKRSFSSGYWLAGADLEAAVGGGLRANVSVLGGATGSDRYFVRAQAGLALELGGSLSLWAGYSVHTVRFHTSTNEADFWFQGPAAGLELRF